MRKSSKSLVEHIVPDSFHYTKDLHLHISIVQSMLPLLWCFRDLPFLARLLHLWCFIPLWFVFFYHTVTYQLQLPIRNLTAFYYFVVCDFYIFLDRQLSAWESLCILFIFKFSISICRNRTQFQFLFNKIINSIYFELALANKQHS